MLFYKGGTILNIDLYNKLFAAYNFILADEKKRAEIECCERKIRSIRFKPPINMPTFQEEKLNFGLVLVLFVIAFPICFIYIYCKYRKNEKNRVKFEAEQQKRLNSPEMIEYHRQQAMQIREAELSLEKLKGDYAVFYNSNYTKTLSFLPSHLRDKRSVEVLLHYVKTGQANTLEAASVFYAKELRELEQMREQRERRDEERRWHEEQMAAAKKISDNQKRIADELDDLRKYGTGRYYR